MADLFNPDDAGCELSAALALADLLAGMTPLRDLSPYYGQVTSPSDETYRELVTVGDEEDPFDLQGYSREELAERLLWVQVLPADEESATAQPNPEQAPGSPVLFGGVFAVPIRRQVRKSENERDIHLFAWDRISRIQEHLQQQASASSGTLRVNSVTRSVPPVLCGAKEEAGQGLYIASELLVAWGDNQ